MLSAATLIMLPLALAYDGLPAKIPAPESIAALLFIMLIATSGAYLLYYRILARAGAANLMLVTLLIPPFAIIFGAAVLGESLPLRSYAGLCLIALGMLVLDGRFLRRLARRALAR